MGFNSDLLSIFTRSRDVKLLQESSLIYLLLIFVHCVLVLTSVNASGLISSVLLVLVTPLCLQAEAGS